MVRRILYTGRDSIWRDIRKFTAVVSKKYPRISTDMQMRQLVTRTTIEQAKTARTSKLRVVILGRDLLADDVTTIPAFPYMAPGHQIALRGSEDNDILPMSLAQREQWLADQEAKSGRQRLSRTYVWCEHNGWEQDVEDVDFDIIMATPARSVFWDPSDKGDWTPPPRAFNDEDLFPFERIGVTNEDDAQRVIKERERHNYVPGASLG